MDGVTLLIAAGVFVVTGALVYLISVTGVRETSYDEAMAEQRRVLQQSKERQMITKKETRPKKHQFSRRRKDKQSANVAGEPKASDDDTEKETATRVSISEVDGTQEDSDDPSPISSPGVTVPDPTPTPAQVSVPALVLISVPISAPVSVSASNAPTSADRKLTDKKKKGAKVEEVKKTVEPMNGEMLEAVKESANDKEAREKDIEEVVVVDGDHSEVQQGVSTEAASAPAPAHAKKRRPAPEKRRNATAHGPEGLSLKRVQSLVEAAPLSRADIQTVIDQLLNKQAGADWIAKGVRPDPMAQLRKQLEEVQNHLNAEQESSASSQERLKILRTELNQEKIRATQQKRALDELAAAQAADAARAQTQEQRLRQEAAAYQQKAAQLQEAGQLQLHQAVTAERMRGKAEFEQQCRELEAARQEQEAFVRAGQQRLEEERERKLAHLEQSHAATLAELQQLQSIHGALERENTTLKQQMTELQRAADSGERAQQRLDDADRQLAGARRHADELRGRADAERAEAAVRLGQAQAEAGRLLNELQETRVELESAREEFTHQHQRQNGDARQHDEQIQQLTSQLAQHKAELEQRRRQQQTAEAAARRAERLQFKQLLVALFPTVNADQLDVDSPGWPAQLHERLRSAAAPVAAPVAAPAVVAASAAETAAEEAATQLRVAELADEKTALEAQVRHYQAVLAETEAILNKLEKSVEAEDQNWQRQLSEKQRELDQLRANMAATS